MLECQNAWPFSSDMDFVKIALFFDTVHVEKLTGRVTNVLCSSHQRRLRETNHLWRAKMIINQYVH